MHLVANAIARTRVVQTVLRSDILQVDVIIGVAKITLQHVVIHIAHRQLCLHLRHLNRLKLQIRQGARGVLGQGLVDIERNFLAGGHVARGEMTANQLLGQIHYASASNQGLPSI